MKWISVVCIRNAGVVSALGVVAFVAMLFSIPYISTNNSSMRSFPSDNEYIEATKLIQSEVSGTMPLEVSIRSTDENYLLGLDTNKRIDEFSAWLRTQEEIDVVISSADILKEMNFAFEGPSGRRMPASNQLFDQYLFINSGEQIYEYLSRDQSHARISIRSNEHGSEELKSLIGRIETKMAEFDSSKESWNVSGAGFVFSQISERVLQSQILSLGVAVIVVTLLVMFLLGDSRLALVLMLPNVAPVATGLAAMAWLGIPLTTDTAAFASIALGIAVDDTIHVTHVFKEEMKRTGNYLRAILLSYRRSGRAILATTIILCMQFGVGIYSIYVPVGDFNLIMAISLAAALLFDLIVLPAIFALLYSQQKRVVA